MNRKRSDYNKLREYRLYEFFSLILWPLWPLLLPIGIIYPLVMKSNDKLLSAIKNFLFIVFPPYKLYKISDKGENQRMKYSILLLLPFLSAVILSPLYLLFFDKSAFLYQIVTGAGNIYFTSLISILFILSIGLYLGKLTYNKTAEVIIMFIVEIIEAVPLLLFLIVILAVFNWWEEIWKQQSFIFYRYGDFISTLSVGICVGIGYLPRIVKLINERIKTFVSENFVDAEKAHGVEQNRILWFHIIRKNCLGDIIIIITQIWASILLLLISLDYLVSIFPSFGAKIYSGWAHMLLTPDTKKAILFLKELNFSGWWLYGVPIFFITTTITGFYLFGDNLRAIYYNKQALIGDEESLPNDRKQARIEE